MPNNFNGYKIDETATYMPIQYGGKPLGFISKVTDDKVYAFLWTRTWDIAADEEGNFLFLDLNGERSHTIDFTPDLDDC